MTEIKFWTYDGDAHCCTCTNKRFGDDALRAQTAIDKDGHRPHPVLWTDMVWGSGDEGDIRCATCDAIIVTVEVFN